MRSARRERVLDVVGAGVGLRRARRWAARFSNISRPCGDDRQQLLQPVELHRRAGERLQRRALREAADPRATAAVEGEVVLPREPAAARHRDREQLVEQLGGAVQLPRLRAYALSLPKFASGWRWMPWPGTYCQTSSEPSKTIALPVRQQRLGGPVLEVALKLEHHHREAGGAQGAALRDALDDLVRAGQLRPARAGEPLELAPDARERGTVRVVGELIDGSGVQELDELLVQRPLLRGVRRGWSPRPTRSEVRRRTHNKQSAFCP